MMNTFAEQYRNLLLLGILAACCSLHCGSGKENQESPSAGIPVTIVSPRRQSMTEYRTLNASTIFLSKASVRSSFQGYVENSLKSIGDSVRIGDVLFRMQTKEAAAADSITLPSGTPFFSRFVDIYSRVNGIVTEINFHPGDYVSDGDQLAKVGEPSSLRAVLNVPYQTVKEIRMSTDCMVSAPGGAIFHAVVDRFVPTVDPASQTQTVLLKFRGAVSLPENLNLIVHFPVKQIADAILLPRQAVLSNETQDQFWIMKVLHDSLAVRVDVVRGIETDSLVQILSPRINSNDRVVLDGAYGLPDTATIILR
ncbi:MAG: efflux RND transporter periplasmic adaptor subunit [Ignavibacteriales bacterium]|nr:efflux RND transporter periplasmic adaptor subunit [Ignavibacteriales bacterium]